MLHSLMAKCLGSQSIHELGRGDRLRSRQRLGATNWRRAEGRGGISESKREDLLRTIEAEPKNAVRLASIRSAYTPLSWEANAMIMVLIAERVLRGNTGSPLCSNDGPISLSLLSTSQSAAIQIMKAAYEHINTQLSAR